MLVFILSNLLTVDLRVQVIVEKIKNNKIAAQKKAVNSKTLVKFEL